MAIDIAQLNEVIRTFVTDTSHVQGAVLATPEGLPIASTLPEKIEETRAAAMAAAVITLSDRIGAELQRGAMQHIQLKGAQGFSILTLCEGEALFLVLASLEAKQGILLMEIERIVEAIAALLR
jgi:uncharacterized protein